MTTTRRLLGSAVATVAVVGVVVGVVVALGAASGDGAVPEVDVAEAPPGQPLEADATLVEGGWDRVAATVVREAERGRPVVVNLFASWCKPCEEEMPLLREVAARRDDVAFVGVDSRDLRQAGERFLAEHPLGFPTVWDFEGEVAAAIGARGMPTTAFFDRDGRMVELHTGQLTEQDLIDILERLVASG